VDKPFQPFRPSDALGAYTDGLDRRFGDMDKPFKDKVVATMKWEDTTLRKYIDKARLENWVRSAAEAAEATMEAVVDQETIAGAQANGISHAEEATPTRKLNGYTNGTH
jgi:nuclear pore complex protein Nup133